LFKLFKPVLKALPSTTNQHQTTLNFKSEMPAAHVMLCWPFGAFSPLRVQGYYHTGMEMWFPRRAQPFSKSMQQAETISNRYVDFMISSEDSKSDAEQGHSL